MVDVRIKTIALRPLWVNDDSKIRTEKVRRWEEIFVGFRDIVEKNKPFYSDNVYHSIIDQLKLCDKEAAKIFYNLPEIDDPIEKKEEILAGVEEVCVAIRLRIESTRVI